MIQKMASFRLEELRNLIARKIPMGERKIKITNANPVMYPTRIYK
jgi:hypothetical protein